MTGCLTFSHIIRSEPETCKVKFYTFKFTAEKRNLMNLKAPKLDSLASQEIRPVSRVSLSDGIVEQLIDLIARDILKAGDRLPSEKELCLRFRVGRTTIREALRSLAVMGILDGRVGEGTFV